MALVRLASAPPEHHRHRPRRTLAVLLSATLVLSLGQSLPVGAAAARSTSAVGPKQRIGTAAGLPHKVKAAATTAKTTTGKGNKPLAAPSQLPPDLPHPEGTELPSAIPAGSASWLGEVPSDQATLSSQDERTLERSLAPAAVTAVTYGAVYSMPSASFNPWPNNAFGGWTRVTVKNTGSETWTPTTYRLGYWVFNRATGAQVLSWTETAKLPTSVAPNVSVTLEAFVQPIVPGGYQIRWDMAKNGVTTFSAQGVPMGAVSLDVVNWAPVLRRVFPVNNAVPGTLTPTLFAFGEDQDRYPSGSLQYRFKICGGTPASPVGCVDSGWLAKTSWAVSGGSLAWQQDYFWQAWVKDPAGVQSPDVGPFWLSTEVPQPAITSHLGSAALGRGTSDADPQVGMWGVDPHVGNYATQAVDATVATVGPALAVTRSYNSLNPNPGKLFGPGWTSPFDMAVASDDDGTGNVVVTLADGRQVRFGRKADGTYFPPAGSFATLLAVTAGGWTLTDKSAMTYTFDAGGKLTRVADPHGMAQELTYAADGTLASARDVTSNRKLSFTWSGGRVSTVTADPPTSGAAALAWTYSYTGGQLTKVCGPTSATACATYGYATGSQYRSVVTDTQPRGYWRLGEPAGTTTADSEVLINQGNDQATYHNVTLGAGGVLQGVAQTAAGFDGTSSNVELPDNLVRGSPYLAVELWFKTTTGGVLFGYQNRQLSDAPGGSFVPTLYVGSDGKLRGQFWDGTQHPITTSGTVNDNQWHHVVLSGAGAGQTLYLDGQPVGSLSGTIDHKDMFFNQVGAGFLIAGWPAQFTDQRAHFAGTIAEVALYQHPLGLPAAREHLAARAQASLLNQVTLPSGKTYMQATYNTTLERVSQLTDANGGIWRPTIPSVSGSEAEYRQIVLEQDQAWSYWQLSELHGTTANSEVTARNGTDAGTYTDATLGVDGIFPQSDDTAAHFNGRTSQVRLADNTILNAGTSLSVELWFKTAGNGVLVAMQNQTVGSQLLSGQSTYDPVLYVGSDGKLYGQFWDGGTHPMSSPGTVNNNTWHHAAITGAGTTQTLYLDGSQVATRSGTIAHQNNPITYIGAGFTRSWPGALVNGQGTFDGEIDEVALYRYPLDAGEVDLHALPPDPLQLNVTARSPRDEFIGYLIDPLKAGRPLDQYDEDGHLRRFEYDSGGFVHAVADENHHAILLGHDARGNTISRTTCRQGTYVGGFLGTTDCQTSFYSYFLNTTNPVDPRNDQMTEVRDARSASASDNTYRTTYTYTTAGDPDSATGPPVSGFPSGLTTRWAYTTGSEPAVGGGSMPAGLLKTVTTPRGSVTSYAYRATGDLAGVTDPAGLVDRYGYDELGRLSTDTEVSDSFPDGPVNQLDADTADLEASIGTWANQANTSVAPTTAQANSAVDGGIHSLQLTSVAAGDMTVRHTSSTRVPVVAGQTYTGLASVRAATVGRAITMRLNWYDAAGTLLLADSTAWPNDSTTGWTKYWITRTAPAGTASAELRVTVKATGAAGEVHYLDTASLHEGSSTTWHAHGLTSAYAYDGWSRLARQTDPPVTNAVTGTTHQARTSYAYDDDGNLTSQTDADVVGSDPTRITAYSYDTHGRVATATDPEGGITTFDYDPLGHLAKQVDAEGNELGFTYTDRNQLAQVILRGWTGDPNNPSPPADLVLASYAYDPARRLGSQTDSIGRTTNYTYFDDDRLATATRTVHNPDNSTRQVSLRSLAYDADGNLTSDTGPGGTQPMAYTYDAAGRLATSTLDSAGLGRKTTLTYDEDDNLTSETSTATGSTTTEVTDHAYDTAGRESRQTVHNGSNGDLVTTWAYDKRGLTTGVTDPRGNLAGATPSDFTTNYTYDQAGQLTTVTQPPVQVEAGGAVATTSRPVSRTGYNTFGDLTEAKDANGNTNTAAYDKLGRPTTLTDPAYIPPGGTQLTPASQIGYDKLSRPITLTDPLGNITRLGYDQLGNLATITDPAVGSPPGTPGVWRNTSTTTGELLSSTDPTGARVEATYDELGRQITSTQIERRPIADAFTTNLGYDDAGNLTGVTTPTSDTTSFAYNKAGELTRSTDPLNNPVDFTYDLAGRPATTKTTDGLTTVSTYDLAGRLTKQAQQDGAGTQLRAQSFGYDANDNQTSATNPLGFPTTWTYDAADQLSRQVEPVDATNSITTSFGYDAQGNQTRFTDGRGNATIYTFNTLGLPESTIEPSTPTYPNTADRTWTTASDAAGQPVRDIEPGGVTRQRTFDQLGRLTHETGSGAEAATTARDLGYDLAGRLTTASAPGGTNTYTYNDRSLLLSAAGPGGTGTYAYDTSGRMSTRTDAAGTAQFTYTKDDQLATATDPITNTQRTYSYNNLRQLTGIAFTGGAARTLGYDNLQRLATDTLKTAAGTTIASIGYGYDTNDRLTSKTTSGTAGAAANTYTYDRADRLTSWTSGTTTTSYAWDAAGNRTQAAGQTATYDARNRQLTNGTTTSTYTPRGTLASRTTGGTTQTFQFDAFDRLTSAATTTYAYDGLDRVTSRGATSFTYASPTDDLVGDGTATYSRTPDGDPLAITDPTGSRATWSDRHGDLVATYTPTATTLATSTAYDPFGQPIASAGTRPSLGYQGQWTDPTTGQTDMGARWYDPGSGAFTSRDSLQLPPTPSADANRYGYANADPLDNTDPTGHLAERICGYTRKVYDADTGQYINDESSYTCGIEDPRHAPKAKAKPTPVRHTPVRHTPVRHTPVRHTPVRHTPVRHHPVRHHPVRHHPVRHTPPPKPRPVVDPRHSYNAIGLSRSVPLQATAREQSLLNTSSLSTTPSAGALLPTPPIGCAVPGLALFFACQPTPPTIEIYPDQPQAPTLEIYPDQPQAPTLEIYPDQPQAPTLEIYPELPSGPGINASGEGPSSYPEGWWDRYAHRGRPNGVVYVGVDATGQAIYVGKALTHTESRRKGIALMRPGVIRAETLFDNITEQEAFAIESYLIKHNPEMLNQVRLSDKRLQAMEPWVREFLRGHEDVLQSYGLEVPSESDG
jgi:RHS repeat-associated protein